MARKSAGTKTDKAKNENNTDTNKLKTSKYPLLVPLSKKFSVASTVVTAFVSYYLYDALTTEPVLPEMDMDYWWSPLPNGSNIDLSVRPYKIQFSDEMTSDLKERLLRRHPFVPPLENAAFTYGFNSTFLNQLLDYWQEYYDFKERETFLNKFPHFVTNIQGLDIHFIRVKPEVPKSIKVIPLLVLHGWPGSIRDFYEMIPKLTALRPRYNTVFEVIASSLPGHGFSQAAVRPGMSAAEVAVIMKNLMERIGFKRFYVHGGGWGSLISSHMATLFPENILGYHTSSPILVAHPLAFVYTFLGWLCPGMLIEPGLKLHTYPLSKQILLILEETGYLHLQATKPDSIGLALTDSPAGLAAYVLEKFSTWTNLDNKNAEDGNLLTKYPLTHLLDNLMIYWSTNTITTSMRLYADTMKNIKKELDLHRIPTEVPTWRFIVKHEIFQPTPIFRLKYKNYLGQTIANKGGYFAAFERPSMVSDDIYKAVKGFEIFHAGKT